MVMTVMIVVMVMTSMMMVMMLKVGVVVTGTAKQASYVGGRHVGEHRLSFFKLIGDSVDVVGVENTEHHFFVNREGDIHFCSLDDSRPVLIAYGMTQLNRGADDCLVVF